MANVITMIKKDAVVNLQIGTGFLQKIQQVLAGIVSEHTEEELQEFQALVEKNETDFPEDWMDHIYTLSLFIRTVEAEAVKQGATYEQDLDNVNTADS